MTMAEIRAFRGLRYSQALVGDLGDVISQPFDVISPEEQDRLYALSEHNVVRLELGRDPGDDSPKDRYALAGDLYRRWRREGVLVQEQAAAIYLTRHEFPDRTGPAVRQELTVALRLEPLDGGSIKPHEYTRRGPKEDRLKLMVATQANVSPVMLLYEDPRSIGPVLEEAIQGFQPIEARTATGERFSTWPIVNPMVINLVREALAPDPLYIADGHHRIETALAYRDQVLAGKAEQQPDRACGFIMATLVEFNDPGLRNLPYHRVLTGLGAEAMTRLRQRIETVCVEERHDMAGAPPREIANAALDSLDETDALFEVWGLAPGVRSTLRLRSPETVEAIAGDTHSRAWAGLASIIFREAVLKPALGVDEAEAEERGWLIFAQDAEEAVQRVSEGRGQLAFMSKSVPMDTLRFVSDRGERLPPKSTYFHPKLATGLVINPLDGVV